MDKTREVVYGFQPTSLVGKDELGRLVYEVGPIPQVSMVPQMNMQLNPVVTHQMQPQMNSQMNQPMNPSPNPQMLYFKVPT